MDKYPLDVQVALHLGLSVPEYCQSQEFSSSSLDMRRRDEARKDKLGQKVISAIHDGSLTGRLALQAFVHFGSRSPDSLSFEQEFPRQYSNQTEDFLYAGSTTNSGLVLTPQLVARDANGRAHRSTKPVTYMYDSPNIPIVQSVLDKSTELLPSKPFRAQRRSDSSGRVYWCTFQENIDILRQSKAHSFVHVVDKQHNHPDYTLPPHNAFHQKQQEEYRIHHRRVARVVIKMTVEDLPSDLLVVDAPKAKALRALDYLHTYRTPLELSDRLGVAIEPFGGSWDLDTFPNIHNL